MPRSISFLVLYFASLSYSMAQDPFVFSSGLSGVRDQSLFGGQTLEAGSVDWDVTLPGGNLKIVDEAFNRSAASLQFTDSATLTHSIETPFTSDVWVLRARLKGTNSSANTNTNSFAMQVEGNAGGQPVLYGMQMQINRTAGATDLRFGGNVNLNDHFVSDVFAPNQIIDRELRLTLINRRDELELLIDDLAPSGTPTTRLFRTALPGVTHGVTEWQRVKITLGGYFTGTLDDIEFFNVEPLLETFDIGSVVDPLTQPNPSFDHLWNIVDTNSPINWAVLASPVDGELLRWKGGASLDPEIRTQAPLTNFTSPGWTLDATITYHLPSSNLDLHKVIFEIERSGSNLGIVIPREDPFAERIRAYVGNESNQIASSTSAGGLSVNNRIRVSATYSRGVLQIRMLDRFLEVPLIAEGFGNDTWTGITIKGDKSYPFSVDNVLFFNRGDQPLSAESWVLYE